MIKYVKSSLQYPMEYNAGISDRNPTIFASEIAGCTTIGILIHRFLGFFNLLEISEEIEAERPVCTFSLLPDLKTL